MNRREAEKLIDRWQATGKVGYDEVKALEGFIDAQEGAADDLRPFVPLLARDAKETGFMDASGADSLSFASFDAPITGAVQHEFTEAVMRQVKVMQKPARKQIHAGKIAVAIGMAAALAVVVGVWHPWARGGAEMKPVVEQYENDAVIVRFELIAPQAHSVSLVGDFNDWDDKTHSLNRLEDGTWVIDMKLRRGELYSYNFLVDKEFWVPDPQADYQVLDPFGGKKSVVSL